jgi:hypothetical protein
LVSIQGSGISIVPCKQPLLKWRASKTKCRACQEWRNAQYVGAMVRCVCSAGRPPGKCSTCAPVKTAATNAIQNASKKLKRKIHGLGPGDEKANTKQMCQHRDMEPTADNLQSMRQRQAEKAAKQAAIAKAAALAGMSPVDRAAALGAMSDE